MSKGYKGGDFERYVCKLLSRWWTRGERDDIYWRSSQSGGRATQRKKKGQRTYGSYGDIAAVDPIGEPLLKLFTIELKRGNSVGIPGDLLDTRPTKAQRAFEKALCQAQRAHLDAGSRTWLLICRRDTRQAMVYYDRRFLREIVELPPQEPPAAMFWLEVNQKKGVPETLVFCAMLLEKFLQAVTPKQIIKLCNTK